MVQESVLETIHDPNLAVLSVWVPMLPGDDERASRRASPLLPDPRVRHFWTGDQELGKAFQKALDLPRVAWDIYFVYPPEALWNAEPPAPETFMHQLRGLPEETMLDGGRLADTIRSLLARE
ncbi:MAG: hypothetical protein ACRDGR_06680 [bacterium]